MAARQHRPGVAQVVEAKAGPAGDSAGGVEVSVQGAGSQVTTVAGRKQQGIRFVPHMDGQMLGDHRHQVRRDGDVTGTGVALGRGHHRKPSPTRTTARSMRMTPS